MQPHAAGAVILAAGSSTRMGHPKALCDFDGRTALELALRTCREAGVVQPIVVLGHAREQIESRVPPGDHRFVWNPDYQHGQTTSLKCGLRHLPDTVDSFFLHPVDYPLILPGHLKQLTAARAQSLNDGNGKCIFIPSYGLKRGHPALIDLELRGDFEALDNAAPARTVINRHAARIHYVPVSTSHVLMDMDTPAEYDRCLEEYRRMRLDRPS